MRILFIIFWGIGVLAFLVIVLNQITTFEGGVLVTTYHRVFVPTIDTLHVLVGGIGAGVLAGFGVVIEELRELNRIE